VGRAVSEALGISQDPPKDDMVDYVASRIADADAIRRSRQFLMFTLPPESTF